MLGMALNRKFDSRRDIMEPNGTYYTSSLSVFLSVRSFMLQFA